MIRRCTRASRWATALLLALAALSVQGKSIECSLSPEVHSEWQAWHSAEVQREQGSAEGQRIDRLLACFDHPDPAIRDQWVFEGLSQLLRAGRVDAASIDRAIQRLQPVLGRPADAAGFAQPFAALLLSELVRADRVTPALPAERIVSLGNDATAFLTKLRDYRAFDSEQGWRHGIAHGADLLLQLGVHPALNTEQQTALLMAMTDQIRNPALAYTVGEPERLARVVFYLHQRGDIADGIWADWLQTLSAPAPLANWGQAFQSESALRMRHNLLSFFHALSFAARQVDSESAVELLRLSDAKILRIMSGGE